MADYPQLQSKGSLYSGIISSKNEVKGTLIARNDQIVFYEDSTNKLLLQVFPSTVNSIIFTPNSINFRINNKKLAFVPDKARSGGIAAGIGGPVGLGYSAVKSDQAGLGTWNHFLKSNGFPIKDKGLGHTVLVGFGASVLFVILTVIAGFFLFSN